MSDTKRKRIELETTANGDRLWLTETRKKRLVAVLDDYRLIAKYAEKGALERDADAAMVNANLVAIAYGLIAPEETTNDDTTPETPDELAHADAADAVKDQTVVK